MSVSQHRRVVVIGNKQGLTKACVDIIDNISSKFTKENVPEIIIYPNIETLNPFQLPKGQALKIHKKMPLNATLLNKRAPSVCAYVEIENSHQYNDQYFKKRLNILNLNVPQYDHQAPVTFNSGHRRQEEVEWDPELGKHGLVGVYKVAANQRGQFKYFIAVYCDAGEDLSNTLYRELKKKANDNDKSPMKMEDLLTFSDDNILKQYENHVIANVKRIMYRCAESMDVIIKHELDGEGSEEHFAPMRAVPDFIQINNTIETHPHDSDHVISYNMATSPFTNEHNMQHNQGNVFILLTPEEGFIVAPIDREKMPKELHGGIPFTLGKSMDYPMQTSSSETMSLNNDKMEDNGEEKNDNIDQSLTYISELNDNLRWNPSLYKSTRTNFITQELEELGWNKWNPVKEFMPVACKQSNVNLHKAL